MDASWDSALDELTGLFDGWNGLGSVAPSFDAKAGAVRLSAALRNIPGLPEFSVDDSDGEISITWTRNDDAAFLSYVVRDNDNVIIVARGADRQAVMHETVPISNAEAVMAPPSDPRLASLFIPISGGPVDPPTIQ